MPPRRLVVGYSMGGAIAQLVARDHRDVVRGLVLQRHRSALAGAETPAAVEVDGRAGPDAVRRSAGELAVRSFAGSGLEDSPRTAWLHVRDAAPLRARHGRGGARARAVRLAAVAAARRRARGGRCSPAATPRSLPRKQRELAAALRAPVFEVALGHLELTTKRRALQPRAAAGADRCQRRRARRGRVALTGRLRFRLHASRPLHHRADVVLGGAAGARARRARSPRRRPGLVRARRPTR